MSLFAPRWRFWLVTLASVLGVGLTASLGGWQLSRAAQKRALQAHIEAQRQRPPLNGAALEAATAAGPGEMIHRTVALQGSWLPANTVFLDNRQMNGKPGFYVLTPFRLKDSGAVVLVQRGWAQRNFVERGVLPVIQTPAGWVSLAGRMAPEPSKLYAFPGADAGVIRQNLDLAGFRAETRLPLLNFIVVQTGEPSEGLLRQWPEPATGVDKHHGYAFQWFGLSGLIALLYVWFQIVRRSPPAHRL